MLADPAKYRNESVTVRGTVDQSASVMGRGAYRLTDGEQGLWVVTSSGAPRKGARVDVTGRLQDGYDLSAFGSAIKLPGSLQSGLVLIESSHRAPRRSREADVTFRQTAEVHTHFTAGQGRLAD